MARYRISFSRRHKPPLCCVLVLLTSTALHADESGHHAINPHQHGSAELTLAQVGTAVHIDLVSPAVNLLGFEHHAQDEAERATLQAAVATLRDGERLLGLPRNAECRQASARIDSPLMALYDRRDQQRPQPQAQPAQEHAEFNIAYRFICEDPPQLRQLDLRVFSAFSGFERIRVKWVTDAGQSVAVATPAQPRVTLAP